MVYTSGYACATAEVPMATAWQERRSGSGGGVGGGELARDTQLGVLPAG